MVKMISKVSVLMIAGVLLLGGCTKTDVIELGDSDQQGIAVGEPSPTTPDDTDLASGTSPKIDEDTAKAMQLERTIDGIESIILRDIEGNVVNRDFNDSEIADIQQAFNDSFIMDTAYIEMMTGYTMTISMEDGREVFISSYGDSIFIVATLDGNTYHLGCETIATILLEGQM
ncbi:MAG: hypothetical protein PF505_07490 [Vallitaleaceae bacterium]|jgi:hypothetical protein|nr:hypothetical protein [Vallitaleaceae bacterium]